MLRRGRHPCHLQPHMLHSTEKREMSAPVTVAYSPKRPPKETSSPRLSHLLSKIESSPTGFDILLDDLDTAPVSTLQCTNPRKQLQFLMIRKKKNIQKKPPMQVLTLPRNCCLGEPRRRGGLSSPAGRPRKSGPWQTRNSFLMNLQKKKTRLRLPSVGCLDRRMRHFADEIKSGSLAGPFGKDEPKLGSGRRAPKKLHVLRTAAPSGTCSH